MNRREFLRHSSVAAATALLARSSLLGQSAAAPATPASPAAPSATPTPFGEFRPLRRHVGYFSGRGGTIGWLASTEALAIVDTQFADTAATCLAGLPERGTR